MAAWLYLPSYCPTIVNPVTAVATALSESLILRTEPPYLRELERAYQTQPCWPDLRSQRRLCLLS